MQNSKDEVKNNCNEEFDSNNSNNSNNNNNNQDNQYQISFADMFGDISGLKIIFTIMVFLAFVFDTHDSRTCILNLFLVNTPCTIDCVKIHKDFSQNIISRPFIKFYEITCNVLIISVVVSFIIISLFFTGNLLFIADENFDKIVKIITSIFLFFSILGSMCVVTYEIVLESINKNK